MCNKCKAEQNSTAEQKWMNSPHSAEQFTDLAGNPFTSTQPNGLGYYELHGALSIMHSGATRLGQIGTIGSIMSINNTLGEMNRDLGVMAGQVPKNSTADESIRRLTQLTEEVAARMTTLTQSFLQPMAEGLSQAVPFGVAASMSTWAHYRQQLAAMPPQQRFGGFGGFHRHPAFITREDIAGQKDERTIDIIHARAGTVNMDVLRAAIQQKLGIFEFVMDIVLINSSFPPGMLRVELERPRQLAPYEVKFITPIPKQEYQQVAKQYPQHFDITITHQGGRINFSAIEEYVAAGSVNREDLPEKIIVTNTSSSNDYAPGFYNVVLNLLPAPFGSDASRPVNYVVGGVIRLAGGCSAVSHGAVVNLSKPPEPKANAVSDDTPIDLNPTPPKGSVVVEYDHRLPHSVYTGPHDLMNAIFRQTGIESVLNLGALWKIAIPEGLLSISLVRAVDARNPGYFIDTITSPQGTIVVPMDTASVANPLFEGLLEVTVQYDNRNSGGTEMATAAVAASVFGLYGIKNIANLKQITNIPYDGIEGSRTIFPEEILNLGLVRSDISSDVWFLDSITSSRGKVMVTYPKPVRSIPERADLGVAFNTYPRPIVEFGIGKYPLNLYVDENSFKSHPAAGDYEIIVWVNHPGGLMNFKQLKDIVAERMGSVYELFVSSHWGDTAIEAGLYTVTLAPGGHDGSFAKKPAKDVRRIDRQMYAPTNARVYDLKPRGEGEGGQPVEVDVAAEDPVKVKVDPKTGNWSAVIKHLGGRINWVHLRTAMEDLTKLSLLLNVPAPWACSEQASGHYTVTMHSYDVQERTASVVVLTVLESTGDVSELEVIELGPIEQQYNFGMELDLSKMAMPEVAEDGEWVAEAQRHWAEGFEVLKVKQTWSPIDPATHNVKIKIMVEGEGKLDLSTMLGANVFVADSLRNKKFFNGPAKLTGFYQKQAGVAGYLITGTEQMESSSLKLTDAEAGIAWQGFHNLLRLASA